MRRTRVRFASCQAVSDALPSLIIAASGLKVVSLLRDAINSGLPKTGPLGTIPPGANPHTPRPHPRFDDSPQGNPKIASREVIHPSPRFEPRPVVHPEPKIERIPDQYVSSVEPAASDSKSTNPIQPPWKTLPWPKIETVIIEPKVYQQNTDVIHKGTLLDLFV